MSDDEVVAKGIEVMVSRSLLDDVPRFRMWDLLPTLSTSIRSVYYRQPGEFIEENEYDGGEPWSFTGEPIRRRRSLPGSRRSGYGTPVRIAEVRPNVAYLASDEAAMLAHATRCACGHLDVFHNHDGEYGVSCGVGDCECYDLRTRLAS